MYDADSIFDAVIEANSSTGKVSNPYEHLLKFPLNLCKDKEFVYRFIPFIDEDGNFDVNKTFYHFIRYTWSSNSKLNYCLSNRTFKERCPIYDWKIRVDKNGSEAEKELANTVRREEGWYANVYVLNDPVTPTNNGTIKIIKLGKKVYDKIMDVFKGSKDDEWSGLAGESIKVGPRILDLSEKGVNFVLRVKANGTFQDYTSSDFTPSKKYSPKFTKEEIENILKNVHDTSTLNVIRSYEECYKFFKETFLKYHLGGETNPIKPVQKTLVEDDVTNPIDDNVPDFSPNVNPQVAEAGKWLDNWDMEDDSDA